MIKNNTPLIILDNFFQNLEDLLSYFKKIPLFSQNEFNKKFKRNDTWPGFRSAELQFSETPLTILLNKIIVEKQIPLPERYRFKYGLHLRLASDEKKDFIHTDDSYGCFKTCIIYLSKTNFNSGTKLYLNGEDESSLFADIKFIQNTACIFNASIPHKSGLNFGSSIEDGRLTLNLFFYEA